MLQRVDETLSELEATASLRDVSGVVRLVGIDHDYRIPIGDFRLGFSLEDCAFIHYRLLHRRNFYRYIP